MTRHEYDHPGFPGCVVVVDVDDYGNVVECGIEGDDEPTVEACLAEMEMMFESMRGARLVDPTAMPR